MIDVQKALATVFAKDSAGELTGESDSSAVEVCKELEENRRWCAVCGQPLKKNQKKFCSLACSALYQKNNAKKRQNEKEKKLEAEEMNKKATMQSECTKCGEEDILLSFTPNYTANTPVGTATIYGTPKALADYQFEYFRQKNEYQKGSEKRISLRIYMLTGDIYGEAKDLAAFQIEYEKLLENTPVTEKNFNYVGNDLPKENWPEVISIKQFDVEELRNIARYLGLPEDSSLAEVRQGFEISKNALPTTVAESFEQMLERQERNEK